MVEPIELGPHHEVVVHDAPEGPLFLVRLRGVPNGDDIRRAMGALEASRWMRAPYAVVWVLTDQIRGFDRSLLSVHASAGRKVLPRYIGVVVWHRMQRAVVRAMSAGLQATLGLELHVHGSEPEAIAEARRRLSGER